MKRACQYFGVSRSGYYKFLHHTPSNLELENDALSEMLRDIFFTHKGRYGVRRIQVFLKKNHQLLISRKRISCLLHKQGLYPKGIRRKYKRQPSPNLTHPNLIEQKFHAKQPNQIWFGDITYIPTHEGILYCSVFIDCFTRKCVGYSIRNHMRDTLVMDSLEAAIEKEQPTRGLIIHTDQGSQYTDYRFYESSVTHHFIHSHSRKGNPYDNALKESFYKSFKREVLPNKQYKTKARATVDIVDYLENYYNSKRMHSSLGYLTPYEFEHSHKST